MPTDGSPQSAAAARRVVIIPGDGIGPEVISVARAVIDASGANVEWMPQPLGAPAHERFGDSVPDHVVAAIRDAGVALKGPVETPIGSAYRSANVGLRRELDLYAQLRRSRSRAGVPSASPGIDVVVVREPTEGLYRGIEFDVGSEAARQLRTWLARRGEAVEPDSGISLSPLSRRAAQRVFDFAFRYAAANGRGRVTAAHKATVMRSTDGLFLATAETVAANHPAVAFDEMLIDRLALELVRNPQRFDVLVMQNLYGDIFSDLAAGLTGGLGYAAGANYGDQVAVFETAHGVVNHRAGADTANPLAAVLSGALLLRHIGEADAAAAVERAVDAVAAAGPVTSTKAAANALIAHLAGSR